MSKTRPNDYTLTHILKYTGVFGGVQGLTMLMGVIRNKLTSKLLGVIGYGLLTEYTTIIESVHNSSDFGIGFSAVRRSSELFESGNENEIADFICIVRTWCLWLGIFGVFLCICGSPILSRMVFMDSWQAHMNDIICLAPMLLCMAVTVGEASILKGMRRLKRVASITALSAILTLLLTVPVYWAFGISGIIIALNLSTASVALIHLLFTIPLYRWHVCLFSAHVLRAGWSMIKIGIPYVIAAIAGSFMAIIIIAILREGGGDEVVGLYRVGFMLMGTYAGLIFAALESDYFPHLSSINADHHACNELINRQISVSVLLIAPLLIAMVVLMPIIINMLYTLKFLPATGMAIAAAFYPFFRAISLPVSYMALARGDSHVYLAMEVLYDVACVLLIWFAFNRLGLIGAGLGLSLSALFDVIMLCLFYGCIYHIRLSAATVRLIVVQALAVAATIVTRLVANGILLYVIGVVFFILSSYISYRVLHADIELSGRIRQRLHFNKK